MLTERNEHRPNAEFLEKSCSSFEQGAVRKWIIGCSRVDHACHGKRLGAVWLDRCHTSPPQRIARIGICSENLARLETIALTRSTKSLGEKSLAVVLKDYAVHVREQYSSRSRAESCARFEAATRCSRSTRTTCCWRAMIRVLTMVGISGDSMRPSMAIPSSCEKGSQPAGGGVAADQAADLDAVAKRPKISRNVRGATGIEGLTLHFDDRHREPPGRCGRPFPRRIHPT